MPEIDLNDAEQGADPDAIHDNIANEISAISEKSSLHDNDIVIIEDSEASFVKKKAKKSNFGGGTSLPVDEATAIVKKTGDNTALARIGATAHIPTGTTVVVHWPATNKDLNNMPEWDATLSGNKALIRGDGTKIRQSLISVDDSGWIYGPTAFLILANNNPILLLWDQGGVDHVCYYNGTGSCRIWAGGTSSNIDLELVGKGTGKVKANQDGTYREVATISGTQTLTNKTLTTPTITDFTNATHDHSAANKGGALADKYKRRVIPIHIESPVDEQEHIVAGIPYTSTVKEVTYHTGSGSVNINFEHRNKTAMATPSTTKLWSSDQSATTTNVTATTFSGTSEIAADKVLALTFDSPSSVGDVYIWLEIEIKD